MQDILFFIVARGSTALSHCAQIADADIEHFS